MRDLSRQLQQGLLPRDAPGVLGYDIAAGTSQRENGHGSSIWDWLKLPDDRFALVTMDVAPGSFPAAHHLAMVRAFLRELRAEAPGLDSLMRRVNTAISRTAALGMASHVECGVLALGSDSVSQLSAGSVPGGVIRREGTMEEFPSYGPPLGLLDGFHYGAIDYPVRAGDVVVALSHGAKGLLRGAADVVAELHGQPGAEVVAKLQKAIGKSGRPGDAREISVLFARKH